MCPVASVILDSSADSLRQEDCECEWELKDGVSRAECRPLLGACSVKHIAQVKVVHGAEANQAAEEHPSLIGDDFVNRSRVPRY